MAAVAKSDVLLCKICAISPRPVFNCFPVLKLDLSAPETLLSTLEGNSRKRRLSPALPHACQDCAHIGQPVAQSLRIHFPDITIGVLATGDFRCNPCCLPHGHTATHHPRRPMRRA